LFINSWVHEISRYDSLRSWNSVDGRIIRSHVCEREREMKPQWAEFKISFRIFAFQFFYCSISHDCVPLKFHYFPVYSFSIIEKSKAIFLELKPKILIYLFASGLLLLFLRNRVCFGYFLSIIYALLYQFSSLMCYHPWVVTLMRAYCYCWGG
jgi:hypothetical protein